MSADAEMVPVAWRWRPKGGTVWFYDPSPEWLASQGEAVEKEPLYSADTIASLQAENRTLRNAAVLASERLDRDAAPMCAPDEHQWLTIDECQRCNHHKDHETSSADTIAALRKDAERYRWLRAGHVPAMAYDNQGEELVNDELDAAIDAAQSAEGER